MKKLISSTILTGLVCLLPMAGMAQENPGTAAPAPASVTRTEVHVDAPAAAPSVIERKTDTTHVVDKQTTTAPAVVESTDNSTMLLVGGGLGVMALLGLVAMSMNRNA